MNDDLNHHGGIKALLGYVLLGAMSELEENFSNVKTPYLLILGSEDKICNVEGSQVTRVHLNRVIMNYSMIRSFTRRQEVRIKHSRQ